MLYLVHSTSMEVVRLGLLMIMSKETVADVGHPSLNAFVIPNIASAV